MVKSMQVIFEEISNALIVSSIVIQCLIFIMLSNKRFALAFKYKVFLTKKRKIWWLHTITSPVTFMFVIGLTIGYLNGGLNPLVVFIVSMIYGAYFHKDITSALIYFLVILVNFCFSNIELLLICL